MMSEQLRVGLEELHRDGDGTCVRSARATAEAKVKAWLASEAASGRTAEADHADDVGGGEFPGEVVGWVLEFAPNNEEHALGHTTVDDGAPVDDVDAGASELRGADNRHSVDLPELLEEPRLTYFERAVIDGRAEWPTDWKVGLMQPM